jgi:DNA-directed RNA polymerase subunit H (RpoH/RPB5)
MPFQILEVFYRPSKLLTDSEKTEILSIYATVYKTNMPQISINDVASIKLGAKENDIICMRNKNTEIYRLVVN